MTCDYQGYEFGAGYLDSVCLDGVLFDADDCDDHGNLYKKDEEWPCPQCRPYDAMEDYVERGWKPRNAWRLVMDIRRNRGLKTQPLALWLSARRAKRAASLPRKPRGSGRKGRK